MGITCLYVVAAKYILWSAMQYIRDSRYKFIPHNIKQCIHKIHLDLVSHVGADFLQYYYLIIWSSMPLFIKNLNMLVAFG